MRHLAPLMVLLAACEPIPPSESVQSLIEPHQEPVVVAPASEAVMPEQVPSAAPDGFDFEADAHDTEPVEPRSDVDLLASMGIEPDTEADTEPDTEALADVDADTEVLLAEEPLAVAQPVAAPASAAWTPDQPVAIGFGVRLVSTMTRAQPPRAILGLSDGSEVVVEPGSMIPSEKVVVLAIGEDAIQIAEVTPMGDRARVESKVLSALYASGSRPAARPQ